MEGEEGDTGNSYASGDKESLRLPESQQHLVDALKELDKPIVLLNMTGSAMDLSYARDDKNFGAILQTWYPGAQGGKAIADILFGKVSPSGKLPVTFYETLEELPDFKDYTMEGRTYRYMKNKAQYPFGFGLTYSKIEMVSAKVLDQEKLVSVLQKAKTSVLDSDMLDAWYEVEAVLKNTGEKDTDEVLQVYVKDQISSLAVPNHSLCGISRVNCKQGDTVTCKVRIPAKAFLVYDEDGNRKLDSNSFTLYVGVSQPDEVSVALGGVKPLEINIIL